VPLVVQSDGATRPIGDNAAMIRRSPVADYHPIEMIPYFRRYKPGPVRDIIYTLIWNCGIGVVFWLLLILFGGAKPNFDYLIWYVLVANLIGYSIHALFHIGAELGLDLRARARGHLWTSLYYTATSTLGVVLGFILVGVTLEPRFFQKVLHDPQWVIATAIVSFLISAVLASISFGRERQARAETALERERLRAERVEREAAHATLRALQAQIEPHFLFNTLANVASLIDSDPALSKRMLERFIRFLRASLAATRAETTTLAAEGDLMAAYLDVIQVRMGARLRYSIDIEPSLASFSLPPMLLQPVVENAIRHGIEPRVEGGEVAISATREGDCAMIRVSDSGVGFAQSTRGGTGLTNLRDRVRLLYGERGAIQIAERPGGGTTVTLKMPA